MPQSDIKRPRKLIERIQVVREWETIRWAFAQGWDIDKRNIIFWIIVNCLGALLPVVMLRATKALVDAITSAVAAGVSPSDIGWQIAGLAVLWVLQSSYYIIPSILRYTMQTRFSIAMQGRYARLVNNVPMHNFDNKEFADRIYEVGATCNRLAYFIEGVTGFCGTIVGTVGLLWLAFSTSPILLGIALIALSVSLYLNGKVMTQYRRYWADSEKDRRQQQYYASLICDRQSGKEIRAMRLADFFLDRWRVLADKIAEREIEIDVKANRIWNAISLMQVIFSFTILGFGVWLLWIGRIQMGALVMLWQLNNQLLQSVQQLVRNYHHPLSYLPVLKDQREIFTANFDQRGLPQKGEQPVSTPDPQTVFALKNVSFSYVPGQPIIENINVEIKRGEIVALVGDNGAGKTTLIKLLLGLYAPEAGVMYFEGLPYAQLTQEFLYNKTGVVMQDFMRFEMSVRENIGFGDIRQINDDEALWRAAKKGQADKIIARHPKGLDASIGRVFSDDGLTLSDGEWQRLGVARAHLSDKEILILDEPAAKLDPVAEMEQFMEIRYALNGRTAILVSHRLGFARLADKILVLDRGRLVENGSHAQLMALNGYYAQMFRAQAEWYEGSALSAG